MKNLKTTVGGILLEIAFPCAMALAGYAFAALLAW